VPEHEITSRARARIFFYGKKPEANWQDVFNEFERMLESGGYAKTSPRPPANAPRLLDTISQIRVFGKLKLTKCARAGNRAGLFCVRLPPRRVGLAPPKAVHATPPPIGA
jgi:hypothetical protein